MESDPVNIETDPVIIEAALVTIKIDTNFKTDPVTMEADLVTIESDPVTIEHDLVTIKAAPVTIKPRGVDKATSRMETKATDRVGTKATGRVGTKAIQKGLKAFFTKIKYAPFRREDYINGAPHGQSSVGFRSSPEQHLFYRTHHYPGEGARPRTLE